MRLPPLRFVDPADEAAARKRAAKRQAGQQQERARVLAALEKAKQPGPPGEQGPRGLQGERGARGHPGTDGADGWTPVLAMVEDGERRVVEITGWIGGEGTPPDVGYLGASGVVADIADAVDLRGKKGRDGKPGPRGPRGEQGPPGIGMSGARGPRGLPGPQGEPAPTGDAAFIFNGELPDEDSDNDTAVRSHIALADRVYFLAEEPRFLRGYCVVGYGALPPTETDRVVVILLRDADLVEEALERWSAGRYDHFLMMMNG